MSDLREYLDDQEAQLLEDYENSEACLTVSFIQWLEEHKPDPVEAYASGIYI